MQPSLVNYCDSDLRQVPEAEEIMSIDDENEDVDNDNHNETSAEVSSSQEATMKMAEPISTSEFGNGIVTVQGPSVEMTCNRLSFQCQVGSAMSVQLAFRNNGTTTLHFEWKWQSLPISKYLFWLSSYLSLLHIHNTVQ
jgi:hypothetical protein